MPEIHQTAIVDKKAEIGADAVIGPYCIVGPGVRIGDRTKLMSHVVVDGLTTIGNDCALFPFASIGTQTQDLKYQGGKTYVEIGDRTTLREYVTVNSGTLEGEVTHVGSGCHIMAYAHVAHQCRVGDDVIIANAGTLAGHVVVEDKAIIGGLCGVHQFVRIGRMSMTGGCTKIVKDVPPFMIADGNPAFIHGINSIGLQRRNVPRETRAIIKKAYKILYKGNLPPKQAVEVIIGEFAGIEEITQLVEFIRTSERGITAAAASGNPD